MLRFLGSFRLTVVLVTSLIGLVWIKTPRALPDQTDTSVGQFAPERALDNSARRIAPPGSNNDAQPGETPITKSPPALSNPLPAAASDPAPSLNLPALQLPVDLPEPHEPLISTPTIDTPLGTVPTVAIPNPLPDPNLPVKLPASSPDGLGL